MHYTDRIHDTDVHIIAILPIRSFNGLQVDSI